MMLASSLIKEYYLLKLIWIGIQISNYSNCTEWSSNQEVLVREGSVMLI